MEPTNESETMVEESAAKSSDVVTIDDINLHTLALQLATSSSQKNRDVDRCDVVVN